ncbi:MAG: type IV pilus twitching motility protein PilT [Nitrospirae bacterium]|nr:type IV pilus twitching motility protein PilT [Nitrospirota bacterium]
MDINDLLKSATEKRASDLHFKVGNPPIVRVDGKLQPLDQYPKIAQEDVVALAFSVMNTSQKQRFKDHNEVDLAYSAPGLGRFRVNIYQQRGSIGMVCRVIPTKILTITDLNLPAVVEKLAAEQRGLILVTGTTGSGKSTTLAAIIDQVNRTRNDNIITIEDPIEFLHRDRKCLISQREVGSDTESFSVALRSALRQDPDVILVGEMRDFETISTALVAAETGHMVMSTLHTVDAAETVNRIISVFPPYQQKQVRLQFASVIKGIVSMRLVPRADGNGRVPAVEVMVATQTIRECIIDPDKTRKIPEVVAAGSSQYGMQTFDQSLYALYQKKLVTYEEALRWCSNPEDFALRVKGIQSTADLSWEQQQGQVGSERKEGTDKFKIERFGR